MNPSKELISALLERATSPDEMEKVVNQLAIPSRLINYFLAKSFDFTKIGLGQCIYLPIQISSDSRGRESLYKLAPGAKTMAGILVNGQDIFFRFVTRETGSTPFAQTNDIYTEEIRNGDGSVIAKGSGKLEVKDPKKGIGEITINYEVKGGKYKQTWEWWAWSFYASGK